MIVKVLLKNSPDSVLVNDHVYEYISNNPRLKSLDFEHNLRRHSSGYAVFQKSWKKPNGSYKVETIYLHRLIGDKFIPKPESDEELFITVKNGNKLDYRLDNLMWISRAGIQRHHQKTHNKTGYRGVYQEHNKFIARIYLDRKHPIELGRFETAEEAAEAYNKKSLELFGQTKSLNRIKRNKETLVQNLMKVSAAY